MPRPVLVPKAFAPRKSNQLLVYSPDAIFENLSDRAHHFTTPPRRTPSQALGARRRVPTGLIWISLSLLGLCTISNFPAIGLFLISACVFGVVIETLLEDRPKTTVAPAAAPEPEVLPVSKLTFVKLRLVQSIVHSTPGHQAGLGLAA